MKQSTLSIIIPAYNEEKTIMQVLDKVMDVQLPHDMSKELIVVNDCSKDNTAAVVHQYIIAHSEANIRLYNQEINRGKGAAIHKGIDIATGDYLIIQDADLEVDPNEYSLLLKPMLDGFADVVYGSRFAGGKPRRIMYFMHSVVNNFLTWLSNVFTNLNLTDMETCYKLFRTEIIKKLYLKEQRFGFEPEVTAKIAKVKGIRIYEVGISYYARTVEDGKKIGWRDGVRAVWCILKYNIFSRKYLRD
jgi:glycosyltransferase involved in cell wall biosynthesis